MDPVAVVRQNYDAFRARDFDAALRMVDEEWTYAPDSHSTTPGVLFRGHEGWQALLDANGWREAEVELDVEMSRVGRYVMAAGTVEVTTVAGEHRANPTASLHMVRDDRVWLSRSFADERAAVAAARLLPDQELTLAFEAAPEAMALLDDDGRIVHGNRATLALLGLPQQQLHGMRIDRFAPPDQRDEALFTWERLRRRGEGTAMAALIAADGTRRIVEFQVKTNYVAGRHLVVARDRQRRGEALLTKRQREVLGLVASGHTGPETAERLYISRATVRTHVQNAMRALGARTRAEAVARALVAGELGADQLSAVRPPGPADASSEED